MKVDQLVGDESEFRIAVGENLMRGSQNFLWRCRCELLRPSSAYGPQRRYGSLVNAAKVAEDTIYLQSIPPVADVRWWVAFRS